MPTPADASSEYKDQIREIVLPPGITIGSNAPGAFTLNRYLILGADRTNVAVDTGTFSPNLGDGVFSTGFTSFSGETYQNPIVTIGYNAQTEGPVNPLEQANYLNFENDYYESSTDTQLSEIYFQSINRDNISAVRPLFFQICNDEADISSFGLVKNAHIYAGGREGNAGLSIMGSKAGSNITDIVCASIGKNFVKLSNVTGGASAYAFGIKTEARTQAQLVVDADAQNAGSLITLYTYGTLAGGDEGGSMLLGGRTGSIASFAPNYPVLGIDCRNVLDSHPGLIVKSKGTQSAGMVEFHDHNNLVMWSWDRDGVVDIDNSVFRGEGSNTATMTNKPGSTRTTCEWLMIRKDGEDYVIPAFLAS